MKLITLSIVRRAATRVYLSIMPKFEKGYYLESYISIPEDPTRRKKATPKRREREEVQEKKAPSVQTTQFVGSLKASVKPSTYVCMKKSLVKEYT